MTIYRKKGCSHFKEFPILAHNWIYIEIHLKIMKKFQTLTILFLENQVVSSQAKPLASYKLIKTNLVDKKQIFVFFFIKC